MHNDINSTTLNCPTCKKNVLWNRDFPFKPFCSERCRLIDLGEWASEGHRITGEALANQRADDVGTTDHEKI